MSAASAIEWTESTWNPVTGCTEVSEGCQRCYAKTFAQRWRGIPGHPYEQGFDVRLWADRLGLPFRWRKPRRVFVNSMSDLFHQAVPDEFIARVFAVMALTPQHTYQVLTKRPGRMRALLDHNRDGRAAIFRGRVGAERQRLDPRCGDGVWPLPNVWLGTSAESQKWADVRVPQLLKTPAAVRFVSCEPLVGPIDLAAAVCHLLAPVSQTRGHGLTMTSVHWGGCCQRALATSGLHWVIVGGESGPGARPMDLEWARGLISQAQEAGIAGFVKQLGRQLGREFDAGTKGGDWDRWPADLRIRNYPDKHQDDR